MGPLTRTLLLFAVLGQPAADAQAQPFGAPVNASRTSGGSYVPSLVRIPPQAAGSPPSAVMLRVFWHDFTSEPHAIWSADVGPDGEAGGAARVPGTGRSWTPRAAVASTGIVHLAWRERVGSQDDVLHARFDGSTWSRPVNVSRSAGVSRHPVLILDPWDRPRLLWEEHGAEGVRILEARDDGRGWSTPASTGLPLLEGAGTGSLTAAFDRSGTLHVAWHAGPSSLTDVHHASAPDGGAWSSPVNVSDTPDTYSIEPALAAGPDGSVHLAWVEQDAWTGMSEICLASRAAGEGWGARIDVTQLRTEAHRPALAVGPDGEPQVALAAGPPGRREIVHVPSPLAPPAGASRSPGIDSHHPSLVLDALGRPFLAWQEGSAPDPDILVAGPDDERGRAAVPRRSGAAEPRGR